MIKPEDIPDSLVGHQDGPDCISYGMDKEEFASILNDAIEAGVVSPPVYTVRDSDGNLLDDDAYGLYASPDSAESKHANGYVAEHWKGQTE